METANNKKGRAGYIVLCSVLSLFIFGLQYFAPLTINSSILYIGVILLTLFIHDKRYTLAFACICTALVLASFLIHLQVILNENILQGAIINNGCALIGMWCAFFIVRSVKPNTEGAGRSNERLDALFEHATEGIIISGGKGEMVMVNPAAERQFGYSKGELLGKRIEMLIPERFSGNHVHHRKGYYQNPHTRHMGVGMDLYAKRKNGSEFPVEISLSSFVTNEGMFVVSFIIDISQRKRQEEAIQREKGVAQLYLEVAPVIFIAVNKEGTVTLINSAGCRILGYKEREIVGKNWMMDLVPPDARERSKKILEDIYHNQSASLQEYENHILTRGGEKRIILWKITALKNEQGEIIATLRSGEDITERKAQEEIIRKTHEELNELNAELEKRVEKRTSEIVLANKRLEESKEEIRRAYEKERELGELKSRFVSMASHEFRNPLSTILTSISLIEDYNSPTQAEKRTKHIERIKGNVKNLTEILNDFLSLGKLEEGKIQAVPTLFNIKELAEETTEDIKAIISKEGQQIKYNHMGKTTEVYLDKNLLRNVMVNLLNNAIKYSAEGKEIIFSTTVSNSSAVITVKDHGIGIPDNDKPHMFDRFFRAHNATNIQGTGLGLNITKKYVDLMSGTIDFTSELNKGTTFTVTLPVIKK